MTVRIDITVLLPFPHVPTLFYRGGGSMIRISICITIYVKWCVNDFIAIHCYAKRVSYSTDIIAILLKSNINQLLKTPYTTFCNTLQWTWRSRHTFTIQLQLWILKQNSEQFIILSIVTIEVFVEYTSGGNSDKSVPTEDFIRHYTKVGTESCGDAIDNVWYEWTIFP